MHEHRTVYWAIPLVLSGLLSGLSCNSETELASWRGEHLIYEFSPSLEVCQGTYARIENFIPFMAGQLGLDLPRLQTYRWLDAHDFAASPCPEGTRGCARGSIGMSQMPFFPHELVHTTLTTLKHPYQPFFGEGIAQAFDPWNGDGTGPSYLVPWIGAETLVDPRPSMTMKATEISYFVAHSFVMFLLARHGSAKFMAFTRKLGPSRDMKVIEREFRAVYGVELDLEAELFMSGADAPCTEQSFGLILYDCTSPSVPWDGPQLSFSGVMDCASDEVVGGFGPEKAWPSLRTVTFDVPTTGRYELRADSDGEISVQIGPCLRCPWQEGGTAVYDSQPRSVELTAGVHFMRIRAMSDESPSFDIVLSPETSGEPGI